MKLRIVLLIAALVILRGTVLATVHLVSVSDYTFSPSGLSIQLGDTVKWVWSSGTHTTTSTTIPSGATSWDANINSSTTTFIYVPSIAGTYNYQCTFHVSMGMTGSFTVSALGVPSVETPISLRVFPNPVSSNLFLELQQGGKPYRVVITEISGKVIFARNYYTQSTEIDLSSFADGIYYIHVTNDKYTTVQKLAVAH